MAETKPKAAPKTERHCPACGELHGSSLVLESEIGQLEGVKVSTLPLAKVYRVHYCGGAFHVQPHEEEVT